MKRVNRDVVVIGAGPAGLAAAISASQAGARDVTIIERDEELGGILKQCIHNGFGLHYFGEELTGPEYAERFIKKFNTLKNVDVKLNTMVLDINNNKEILVSSKKDGIYYIRAKSVVLAMGARERTRGAIAIPGTRPAGIMTAGTAQRLVNIEGLMIGKKVFILGSGDIGMIMARRLTWEGAKVEGVAEIMPYPTGLTRNRVQCLEDNSIPLYLGHTITEIKGDKRIKSVMVSRVDERKRPILKDKWETECDTLLLSVGLIPENELSRKINIKLSKTGGPIVDEARQTSMPGIFAGGNVLQIHDMVDNVSRESEIAGENAAFFAMNELQEESKIEVRNGEYIRYVVPNYISASRGVEFYMRSTQPLGRADLIIKESGKRFPIRYVTPAEMIVKRVRVKDLLFARETGNITFALERIEK